MSLVGDTNADAPQIDRKIAGRSNKCLQSDCHKQALIVPDTADHCVGNNARQQSVVARNLVKRERL